jgi:hypothetical protein
MDERYPDSVEELLQALDQVQEAAERVANERRVAGERGRGLPMSEPPPPRSDEDSYGPTS